MPVRIHLCTGISLPAFSKIEPAEGTLFFLAKDCHPRACKASKRIPRALGPLIRSLLALTTPLFATWQGCEQALLSLQLVIQKGIYHMNTKNKTIEKRCELIKEVKKYLAFHEGNGPKFTTTIRGYLEIRTEQIRVVLDALCAYESDYEEKMKLRDELLHIFFKLNSK